MQAKLEQTNLMDLLTTTPPGLSVGEAARLASDYFGIEAAAWQLDSERDQNFRLDASDGGRYVLKIANPAEKTQTIDFQNSALNHIAKTDATLPIPKVIPDLEGRLMFQEDIAGEKHIVRVLSWLDGVERDDPVTSPKLAAELGYMLARLGLALQDFTHPGSDHDLLWDMKRAAGLREIVVYSEGSAEYDLIVKTLDHFEQLVQPKLLSLRRQVIFNDLHAGNVLVDKNDEMRISGIIDFGDLIRSPLIIDLAVASSYQLAPGEDPLIGALPMIAAYDRLCPLQDQEMELLTDLIRTRLITSLIIGTCRSQLFPENSEYVLNSNVSAANALETLQKLRAEDALRRIRSACGKEHY